jgi:hypothetical protein
MLALLKVFVDIALWRKGPQHLPASGLLLVLTALAYFAMSLALGSAQQMLAADIKDRPVDPVFARTVLEMLIVLGWMWLLLALFKRSDRFWQSATALMGTGIVISPVVIVAQLALWRIGPSNPVAWPVWLTLLAAGVWYLLVVAHIVRSTLEIRLFPAIALTMLYAVSEYFILVRLLGNPAT